MPATDSQDGHAHGAAQAVPDATMVTGGAHRLKSDFFNPGEIIGGSYQVIQPLGQGAMGMVYKASHVTMGSEYAVKVLSTEFLNDNAMLRFQNEAQALAKLNHPNVIAIYNFGLHDDRLPFYAMEFLSGDNLLDKIDAHGPMPVSLAMQIFIEVCAGLSYAHKKGILHRDVKPANIVLLNNPDARGARVKVVDFGLVKFAEEIKPDIQKLTAIGEVCGSPSYMSPEQTAGQKIDPRSDIYSLGISIFQAVTGKLPFRGRTATDTMMMQHEAAVPTLASQGEGRTYPEDLELLVAKMMAKQPMDRYQNMDSVANDLRNILEGKALGTPPSAPQADFGTGSYSAPNLPAGRTSQSRTSGPIAGSDMERSQSIRRNEIENLPPPASGSAGAVTARMRRDAGGRPLLAAQETIDRAENSQAIKKLIIGGVVAVFVIAAVGAGSYFAYKAMTPKAEETHKLADFKLDSPMEVPDKEAVGSRLQEDSAALPGIANETAAHFENLKQIKLPNEQYFSKTVSQNGRQFIEFDFPKVADYQTADFGAIFVRPDHYLKIDGKMLVPKGAHISYTPSEDVFKIPHFLEKFRPGDVQELTISQFSEKDDEFVIAATKLKGLTELGLNDCSKLTNGILPTVCALPLTSLCLNNTNFDMNKLAKAHFVTDLRNLEVSNCTNVRPILEKLSGSKDIESLNVSGVNLSPSDYQLIARMPNLKFLNISNCKVSGEDLRVLSKLSKLKEIVTYLTRISDPSLGETLSRFSSLCFLDTCEGYIKKSDLQLLAERKPHLRIRQVAASRLDKRHYGLDPRKLMSEE